MSEASLLMVFAAASFVLTPLLWQLAVSQPAALLPLLPLAVWIGAVIRWATTGRPGWGLAAGAALGAGVYSSTAAIVMMPAYLAITLAVFASRRLVSWRDLGACAGVFMVAAAPLLIGWIRQPAQLRDVIMRHHLYDADRFSVLQGVREITSWVGLTARSEVYWDYFNPAFLFLTGGVLFPALIVFLPLGLVRLMRQPIAPLTQLWLFAFALAPLAASLPAEPPVPARALYLTPFAAIIAAEGLYGAMRLVKPGR